MNPTSDSRHNLVHNNLQRHFIFWIQATVLSAQRNGHCIGPMTFFQLRIWNIEDIDLTYMIAVLECRNDVTVTPRFVVKAQYGDR
jgi:hypothetical protein